MKSDSILTYNPLSLGAGTSACREYGSLDRSVIDIDSSIIWIAELFFTQSSDDPNRLSAACNLDFDFRLWIDAQRGSVYSIIILTTY
jgi:hypothetical protein